MLQSRLVLVAIGSLSLGGCGTFSDKMCGPANDHVFYRGVRFDVEAIKEGGPRILMVADIPFSAVADTLLVPSLAYQELTDPPSRTLKTVGEEPAKADPCKPESPPRGSPRATEGTP
jgi:uncharacterized protein YceK